ncbi:MAG: Rne/Rng family ribonuclease [Actinobacteria bacterium]|nr:Rne/Rng family ribonuclease [Actinomycetota bacterium]
MAKPVGGREIREPTGSTGESVEETPKYTPRPKIGDTRPAPVAGGVSGTARARVGKASTGSGKSSSLDTLDPQSAKVARRSSRGVPPNSRGSSGGRETEEFGVPGSATTNGAGVAGADVGSTPVRVDPDGNGRSGTGTDSITATARKPRLEPQGDNSPAATKRRSRKKVSRGAKGRALGRYTMCVHSSKDATQIAVLEGRTLVEHYVSKVADDFTQIDGNIYLGRVQNVLPGMEAAFIDIATPKNAVLYRGDVRYDREDIEPGAGGKGDSRSSTPRIEEMLKPGQLVMCQVTKNPIGSKGARLTQEVSLPGRFVVMVPDAGVFGISRRIEGNERKRLRKVIEDAKPEGVGIIARTAAQGASADEIAADINRLVRTWADISARAAGLRAPALLYREPDLAIRLVREELNSDYRLIIIDDPYLYQEVRGYVEAVNPDLADRVELYDPAQDVIPLFERYHVQQQLHKSIDRKVWLPSGGSIIIERTEALTVIDVNTSKNVGTSNLEETVYANNLEAAEEIARQLRLRDIGGIIVIDFIDMEIRGNRDKVAAAFRSALARDKTRTQVFDISELGLVEMTRKRISEGLVESLSEVCPTCSGSGMVLDPSLF